MFHVKTKNLFLCILSGSSSNLRSIQVCNVRHNGIHILELRHYIVSFLVHILSREGAKLFLEKAKMDFGGQKLSKFVFALKIVSQLMN